MVFISLALYSCKENLKKCVGVILPTNNLRENVLTESKSVRPMIPWFALERFVYIRKYYYMKFYELSFTDSKYWYEQVEESNSKKCTY